MTTSNSKPIQIGSTVRLTGNYRPLDAQVRLGISILTGIVEYISGVNHSNVGVRFSNGQFFNCQLSELEVSEPDSDCFNAGEFAQSSEDSPVATLPAATYSQTLLDGVYDVVASGVAKVKAKFSKRVDSSPPPVQLTVFDVLLDLLVSGFKRLQALFFPWSETVVDANGHPKPEFKDEYYSRYNALNSAYFELDEFRSMLAVSS